MYILVCVKSLQLCLTLCDTMNCSLQRSSIHRILQARILWWVVVPSSRESSQPRNRTCISFGSCTASRCFSAEPLEKPIYIYIYMHTHTYIYGKSSACNVGDPGSISVLGRAPKRRKCQPTPVFLPGESNGQRSLLGYSPWDHKSQTRLSN